MNDRIIIELIGYVGSAMVLVSMLMVSVIRLRVLNLIGNVIFMVYALIIRSYPTAIMDFFLCIINGYHLLRLLREQKVYDLVPADPQGDYVRYLLDHWRGDIAKWFPEFSPEGTTAAFLVCCESNPAGLLLGREAGDGVIEVLLDYAMPVYRDTTVGRYLYEQLAKRGYRSLVFRGNAPEHTSYMEKVGYRQNADGAYVLDLTAAKA